MNVISEETLNDGSSWAAIVELKQTKFAATYVNGRVNVYALSRNSKYRNPPRWMCDYIQKWGELKVKKLPQEWHEKHKLLYQI